MRRRTEARISSYSKIANRKIYANRINLSFVDFTVANLNFIDYESTPDRNTELQMHRTCWTHTALKNNRAVRRSRFWRHFDRLALAATVWIVVAFAMTAVAALS